MSQCNPSHALVSVTSVSKDPKSTCLGKLHTSVRRTLLFCKAAAKEVCESTKVQLDRDRNSFQENYQQNPEEVQAAEIVTGYRCIFKKLEQPEKWCQSETKGYVVHCM